MALTLNGSDPTGDLGDLLDAKLTTPGAWTAYTPTWTGASIGNGTVSFVYSQIGKTVFYQGRWTLGSTSTVTGPTDFTLPVAAGGPGGFLLIVGDAMMYNNSVVNYGKVQVIGGSTVRVVVSVASTTFLSNTEMATTTPFTWGNTHSLAVCGTYQAA